MSSQTYTHRFSCGAATITIFNACDLQFDLRSAMKREPGSVAPAFADAFTQPLRLPVQCILIQLPRSVLLVDAGRYDFGADSPFALPEYQPPPGLPQQLQKAACDPEQIDHIVITHAHGDHYNALTKPNETDVNECKQSLNFPNAQVYLSRADWERPDVQQERRDPTSTVGQTLEQVYQAGRLLFVDGDLDLGYGISILATPGETVGHQIVRVESAGEVLYCLGDLFHHEYEVAHPAESVFWVDAELNHRSRQEWLTRAQNEDALLIATHIRDVGRLVSTDAGPRWTTVTGLS